jgi:hypothetical protein
MSKLKTSEETGIPMGNYYKKVKGEDGKYVLTDLGRELRLVVLRIAQQYTYYDEVLQKTVMKTTEFGKGVSDSLICTDADNNIQFEGTAKDFKEWALKNHPKFAGNSQYPQHMFKYRTVIYVANPYETKPGSADGVYRMYMSTACNDYLWAYQNEISGFPIRYETQFVPEAKDNGAVRYYVHKMSVVDELSALSLIEMIKLKQELDSYLNGLPAVIKTPKVDEVDLTDVMAEAEEADEGDIVRHAVPNEASFTAMNAEAAPIKSADQAIADANAVFG